MKISPQQARKDADARRCPHCKRGGGLKNWRGSGEAGGRYQDCRYCGFSRTWTPELGERDHFPEPKQPPPQPAASEAALRAVLLEFCRWCLDLPPFQDYATPEEAVDTWLAARAAAGGGK